MIIFSNGIKTSLTIRISTEDKHMVKDIAKRFGLDSSEVIRRFISDGIKATNTDLIVENSHFDKIIGEIKDFLEVSISKSDHRLASLLSKILITSYENKGTLEELLKLIVGQLYQEEHVEEMLDEIQRKVNTAAIVKIKRRKVKELVKSN